MQNQYQVLIQWNIIFFLMNYRTNIEVPQLKDQDIITCYSQLRPSRQGGIRIERQVVDGKNIIHNYGHGGAGVSLSPSTAYQAVNLAKDLLKPQSKVAIIGSGIVGIMTAYQLLERDSSLKITLYSQQIPTFNNKDNKNLIPSEVAPGFWLPYSYGCQDEAMHLRQCSYAYQWYKNISQQETYKQFVKECDFYNLSDDSEEGVLEPSLTEQLKPSLREMYVTLNGKTKVRCTVFKTIKIDLQAFLLIFTAQLRAKGTKFVQRRITRDCIKELKESVIFNCSGLGSRDLFGDNKLRGTKGHLVEYKNLHPQKYDYLMRANVGNKRMSYYMHASRILIGRTIEKEENREVDLKVVKQIQDIHRLILQKFNLLELKPKM